MIKDATGARRYYGIYRGKVVNNKDPQKKRRLSVQVPGVLFSQSTSWAWPMEVASTKTEVPNVGQGVWVMFEAGDPSFPVWSGVFGKNINTGKHTLIKPLPSNVSFPAELIKTSTFSDGTIEIELNKTLVAMAKKIVELETLVEALQASVSSLDSRVSALETP